ncbi:MAG: hypothetical protein ABSG23_18575 [Terriglobales bacterium]
MSRMHPERPDSSAPDYSVAADVLLRQEPDEEEDEEEDKDKEDDNDNDTTDDGYSERACPYLFQWVQDDA